MAGQGNIILGSIQSGGSGGGSLPPGVTDPWAGFTIGDGQIGTPAPGATVFAVASFDGQSMVNKRLLVLREGIPLNYNTPVNANGEIRRYNSGGLGGFTLQGGLVFGLPGERWQIYIINVNNTIET